MKSNENGLSTGVPGSDALAVVRNDEELRIVFAAGAPDWSNTLDRPPRKGGDGP
jgi:hypothetical protein